MRQINYVMGVVVGIIGVGLIALQIMVAGAILVGIGIVVVLSMATGKKGKL